MILTLILGFILGAAAIIFILENTTIVALSFLQYHFETSVALVVIISLLVGAIITLLLTLPGAIGTSLKMRRMRKHNEELAKVATNNKAVADEAQARLINAQTPRPDVIDLTT